MPRHWPLRSHRSSGTGTLRLAEIARAIAGSPRVLLLDEPAAGLNSVETHDLAVALRKLRSPQLVLVVVEHDMDLIMEVCDQIHVLNVGRLLASGDPARSLERSSPISLPMVARSLGRTAGGALGSVYLPLMKGSVATAMFLKPSFFASLLL